MHPNIDRLKKRKFVQWALAYLAAAGVVYSMLDGPLRIWGITDSQLKTVQVLLLMGFFIALTLAWYHGERGEQRVTGPELLIIVSLMGLGAIGVRLLAGDVGAVGIAPIPSEGPMRLSVVLADDLQEGNWVYLGPSGTGFAYVGEDGRVWYRDWDADQSAASVPVDGSEGWSTWYLSRTGTQLALIVDGELRVVAVPGGLYRSLASAVCCVRLGFDDFVYFTGADSAIHRIPFEGGDVEPVTEPVPGERHGFFEVVEGGRYATMAVTTADDPSRVELFDMETGERAFIANGARPTVTRTGHLVFGGADGRLYAAPFDSGLPGVTRDPIAVFDSIPLNGAGRGLPLFNVSSDGMLVIRRQERGTLVSVSPLGSETVGDPLWIFQQRSGTGWWEVSPDDRRIAVEVLGESGSEIWVKELPDGPFSRISPSSGVDRRPIWSADGAGIIFTSDSLGERDIWRTELSTGRTELLWKRQLPLSALELTPHPNRMLVRTAPSQSEGYGRDIFEIDLAGQLSPRAVLDSPSDELMPALSPDGEFLAYVSDQSGRDQVYVESYLDRDGTRIQVSRDGGISPVWSRDGLTLFFLELPSDGGTPILTQVPRSEAGVSLAARRSLFALKSDYFYNRQSPLAVDGLGNFWFYRTEGEGLVDLIVNFHGELERLLPN